VFTNQDLVGRGGTTQPDPSAGEAKAAGGTVNVFGPSGEPKPEGEAEAPGASGEGTSSQDPKRRMEYWRSESGNRRAAIEGARTQVGALETRLAELQNDLSPTNLADPNREQTRQAEIAKAREELDAARVALAEAEKSLADLEEEARRLSIPPGWLR
jgi:hypothetical protein